MLYLTAETKILFAVASVDFRSQIDGLISICEQRLNQSPRSGTLFVFLNRSRTMIRILCYHENGYWVATKRLSQGRFLSWPTGESPIQPLQAAQLTQLLKGVLASNKKSV
jgi:transposase